MVGRLQALNQDLVNFFQLLPDLSNKAPPDRDDVHPAPFIANIASVEEKELVKLHGRARVGTVAIQRSIGSTTVNGCFPSGTVVNLRP